MPALNVLLHYNSFSALIRTNPSELSLFTFLKILDQPFENGKANLDLTVKCMRFRYFIYHIDDLPRLRGACIYQQSYQSLYYFHTQSRGGGGMKIQAKIRLVVPLNRYTFMFKE